MTCRRICRELLWSVRFGELDASSQPHLEHLAGCGACRDEVGFDREVVRQLRVALDARVDGMAPSATAWDGILRRAQAPERSRWATLWSRSLGVVVRLRTATAMAGTGLALILALNTQVISIVGPGSTQPASPAEGSSLTDGGGWVAAERSRRLAFEQAPGPDTLADPQPLVVLPPPRQTLAVIQPAFQAGPGEVGSLEITISASSSPPSAEIDEPVTETLVPPGPVPTELAHPS
jgi:anti-sigma factor RsiW